MTITYFPFDTGDGANVTQVRWSDMARLWRADGVIPAMLNELEVYADGTSMSVNIKTGKAWIKGHYFSSSDLANLPISGADVTNPRYDIICIRVNWNTNTCSFVSVEGTPASTPVDPTLTQTDGVMWEFPLARVLVGAGVTVIAADKVTDMRSYSVDDTSSTIGVSTLSGNAGLDNNDPYFLFYDPNGANRDITLPAEASSNHPYTIYNTANDFEDLIVKNDGGTTIGVVHRGASAQFTSDATNWRVSSGRYKNLWIAGFEPTLTSGCGIANVIEMSTNKNVYRYLPFDASTIEYAYANITMPDDYSGGTVFAKFYWTHPATTTNFGVSWGLSGVAISDDDALDVAQGTEIYANDTGGTTSDLYISPVTTAITIAGTPVAHDLVHFKLQRKADDGTNDTLAVDAYLIGVMLYYPTW